MRACRRIAGLALVLLATFAVAQKPELNWDWRSQEMIGREDPSVGNTSKLTEPERGALIDAIVLRLQKPMGDAGYDDDRIREIATTTRIRFVDVGSGSPLIFTTSMGLEGGCDALGNCPLWVFRHTDDGFLSLLNTIAATFTPKRDEGGFEVVFLHHLSAKESGLAVYRFADDKLEGTGCYTALWPKASSDPNQVSEPRIEPCKQSPLLESAHPVKPDASEPQAPLAAEPAEQPEAQPKPETAEPKEQAPATEAPKTKQPESAPEQPAPQPAPKSDQAQPEQPSPLEQQSPDAKQENPRADQTQPQPPADESAPPDRKPAEPPKQEQPQEQQPPQQTRDANQASPDDKQAQPSKPDQPTQETPSANPEPAPSQTSPQEAAPSQPSPDSKQAPPSSPDQQQPNRSE